MDEADADGEWSDDDILQSGSQTGISETEPEDYRGRRGQLKRQHQPYNNQKKSPSTPVDRSLPIRQVNNTGATSGARMTGGADPVDEILDKIDAELDAMDQTSTKVSWKPDLTARAGTPQPRTSPGLFSKQYTPNPDSDVTKAKNTFGPETMFNTSSRTNGFPEVHSVPDIPAELDAVTAHQTDLQFKEIMRKKKVNAELSQNSGKSLGSLSTRLKSRSTSRPSAMMLSTGYGTDNESIQTEEFESRFMGMVISPSDTEKGETMVKPL
ncbi:uncharacterized protein LOC131940989, partial [Physella acuta]|uniref:uncharacterized protein LOC131940989 n=1 Tax=Physella acuta TaxID=109671 RepID=UPI0027DCE7B2